MTPDPPQPPNTAVFDYMPAKHVEAFKRAAAYFHALILVRRGNSASRQWIGVPHYTPKPFDCKAKTAEQNVGSTRCGGLVASPILLPAAFPNKLDKALEEWREFEPLLYQFDAKNPQANMAAFRENKHYTLQLDKSQIHYGCVILKGVQVFQGEYIHADYDLYAVVRVADPKSNIFVSEMRPGNHPHARSQLLYDVQYFLKAAGILKGQEAGSPMIRHGEQETFKTDWDEKLDVFWPDGKSITELIGSEKIQEFYRTTLQGRQQVGKNTATIPVSGKWVKT
jgi:hypothetical protein